MTKAKLAAWSEDNGIDGVTTSMTKAAMIEAIAAALNEQ